MSNAPNDNLRHSKWVPYVELWRNPLARGWDRGKPLFNAFLLAVWLLILPVAATVGSVIADRALNTADQQIAQLTDADAVVLVAVPQAFDMDGNPVHRTSSTLVQWRGGDGQLRQAQAPVDSATPVGAHTRIPLDRAGNPAPTPQTSLEVVSTAVTVVLVGWLWIGALLGLLDVGVHRLHRRSSGRRLAKEWASMSARWTLEGC